MPFFNRTKAPANKKESKMLTTFFYDVVDTLGMTGSFLFLLFILLSTMH